MFYKFAYIVLSALTYIIYPMRIKGRENVPSGGAVVCANHTALYDCIFVGYVMGFNARVRIMGKKELFDIKPLGVIFRALGAFPVNRGGADVGAVKTSLSSLKKGEKLIIFPEGRRIKSGEEDTAAQTGAAMFALRSGAPVLPIYITKNKRFFHRVDIVIGKPYYPAVEGKPTSEDYRRVANEIMERINSLGEGLS